MTHITNILYDIFQRESSQLTARPFVYYNTVKYILYTKKNLSFFLAQPDSIVQSSIKQSGTVVH